MKKLLFFAIISALVLSVSSCKKNDASSLAGTTWKASGTESWGSWTETFTFTTASSVRYSYEDSDHDADESYTLTYTYTPPTVVFSKDGRSISGTINGNTMTIEGDSYTKQ